MKTKEEETIKMSLNIKYAVKGKQVYIAQSSISEALLIRINQVEEDLADSILNNDKELISFKLGALESLKGALEIFQQIEEQAQE